MTSTNYYFHLLNGTQEPYTKEGFLDSLRQIVKSCNTGMKLGSCGTFVTCSTLNLVYEFSLRHVTHFTAEVKDCILAFLTLQYMTPPSCKEFEIYETLKCIQDQIVAWADGSVSQLTNLQNYVQSVRNKRLDSLSKIIDLRINRLKTRASTSGCIILNLGKPQLFNITFRDTIPPIITTGCTVTPLQHKELNPIPLQMSMVTPYEVMRGGTKRKRVLTKGEGKTKIRRRLSRCEDIIAEDATVNPATRVVSVPNTSILSDTESLSDADVLALLKDLFSSGNESDVFSLTL